MSKAIQEWDERYHTAAEQMMNEASQTGVVNVQTLNAYVEEWVQRFVHGHPRPMPRDVIIEVHGIGSQAYLDVCTALNVGAEDYEEVTRVMNECYRHLLPPDLQFAAQPEQNCRCPILRLEEVAS